MGDVTIVEKEDGQASTDRASKPEAPVETGGASKNEQPNPEPETSKIVDLACGLWVEQFTNYLDGKPFRGHSIPDDARPLKIRAMSAGLEEYDKLAPSGAMTKDNLESSLKADPFGSFDPLGLQLLLGNFELVDGLESRDGRISRSELARLSIGDTNLRTYPITVPAKSLGEDETRSLEGQRARTGAVINSRIDKFPTHSQGNYFDTAVKGMAKAVLNGDVEAFKTMVDEFSSHQLLDSASKKLDYLLCPAGVRVRVAENRSGPRLILTAKDGSMICFSPTDGPVTDDLRLSASEVMTKIGRQTAVSADKMAEYFASEDRENLARQTEKKLIQGLSAGLDAGESKIMAALLAATRNGDMSGFNKVVSAALRLDSNRTYNVANALNEIVGEGDIRFTVTNEQGTDARMQIRNRSGDKSLTITSRNELIVGATGVAAHRDADSIAELTKWVYESVRAARQQITPSPVGISILDSARSEDAHQSSITGLIYDGVFKSSPKPDFWQQLHQQR